MSPNNKLLVYAKDTVGGEFTLHLKEISSGSQLLSIPGKVRAARHGASYYSANLDQPPSWLTVGQAAVQSVVRTYM